MTTESQAYSPRVQAYLLASAAREAVLDARTGLLSEAMCQLIVPADVFEVLRELATLNGELLLDDDAWTRTQAAFRGSVADGEGVAS
jgi:hypothetical protein